MINKFFDIKKSPLPKTKSATKRLAPYDCSKCGLDKECQTPKMPVYGKGKRKILLIAEAPGGTEDAKGRPLIGEAGQILRDACEKCGLDIDNDCWQTNAVICRPMTARGTNRTPTAKEIRCCHKNLDETIKKLNPDKIILLGSVAAESFTMYQKSPSSLKTTSFVAIPDQHYGAWVFMTYHPSFILRNPKDVPLKKLFESDINHAVCFDHDFPDYSGLEKKVKILKDDQSIIDFIQDIIDNEKEFAFDYETTGIKPYRKGHRIVSMSISAGPDKTAAFKIPKDSPVCMRMIQKLLRSKIIGKIAHNMSFENVWTKIIWGFSVNNWVFDTMHGAHILINTQGITSLKFQTYVNFGVEDYSSDVMKYLKASDPNSFNTIDECDEDTLLLYNGLDSLHTKMLADMQRPMLAKLKMDSAYDLFHAGSLSLADVSMNGVAVDSNYYEMTAKHLQRKLDYSRKKILNADEARLWMQKEGKELNFNSDDQIAKLLFKHLKYKSTVKTKLGNDSTDIEALSKIKTKFVQSILENRKISKIKNTYLEGFITEDIDGIMHPNFLLNTVRTYRGSSSNPNFQNVPVRDEESQRTVRSGIIPRPGRQLMDLDFKGIEVGISCCYHHDKEMIAYVSDKTKDMHRDMAMKLFKINDPKEVSKRLRQASKNGFVFPEFYGDYYVSCAANIWSQINDDERAELSKRGIKNLIQFERHVQKIEEWFWYDKFTMYTDWKIETWEKYIKKGFVEFLTGFRCIGRMDRKNVINYPIQGTAFHVLLLTLILLQKYMTDQHMDSCIIGQIHDDIVSDIVPDEKEDIKAHVNYLITDYIPSKWKWIVVPLDVECEITDIDGSWYTKHKESM